MTRRGWTAAFRAAHPSRPRARPAPVRPDEARIPRVQVADITLMGKPRQTQRDRFAKRPSVLRYRALCDALRMARLQLPEAYVAIVFLPMPASWSATRKNEFNGAPHRSKPDRDNLDKTLLDALAPADDARFHDGRLIKRWAYRGRLVLLKYPTDGIDDAFIRRFLPRP